MVLGIKIYNTLTRKKEEFETIEPNKVRLYVCGPTVYDRAHVGHAMSSIVFDVMRRYLEYKGYEVKHVMNYTDVDDKVIRRANELNVDALGLAEKYIKEYDEHLVDLNVLPAHVNPRVSLEIDGIIEMVESLVNKDYAYEVDGDVFFRVDKDDNYGILSGRKVEDMQAGFRLEVDVRKEHPADFALWKSAKEGEPAWESPWGMGRPGWHIECSAMALRHLGNQIDIHGGGNDLIFPHHENEIAQTESITGEQFARYWAHNGMLQIGGEAMSKSVGNMVTVEEFLQENESDVLRLMFLNASYRAPLTFTNEVIEQAERGLKRLCGGLRPAVSDDGLSEEDFAHLTAKVEDVRVDFETSMDDDFNTPGALSSLFELVRSINQARDAGASDSDLSPAQETLKDFAGVLGLGLSEKKAKSEDVVPLVDLLISIRKDLRDAEQWALADRIRDELADLGILIEDSKSGTSWRNG
jgi:cysteinyl-tRNA synthetase